MAVGGHALHNVMCDNIAVMKHRFTPRALVTDTTRYVTPHLLRGYALRGMLLLVLLSFLSVNLQALLWQTSDWLVGTILPAVVVDLTNQERQALAAEPLRRNATLDEAARLKAEHMAREGYFAHFSPTGVTPWHWFKEAGYPFVHAGENLAIHFSDSSEVVTAWMNSPTHRDNIVDPKYLEIGVGTARGVYQGYETVFVVQLFGAPAMAAAPSVPTPPPTPVSVPVVTTATPAEATAVVPEEDTLLALSVPTTTSPVQVAGATDQSSGTAPTSRPAVATETPGLSYTDAADPATTTPDHAVVTNAPATTTMTATAPAATPPAPATEVAAVEIADDVVSVYSGVLTSSTPLLPASIETTLVNNAGTSAPVLGRLATQPSSVLQALYLMIGGLVGLALFTSVLLEWRRHHPLQVAYGVLLLFVMSGLFYFHTMMTSGALIV